MYAPVMYLEEGDLKEDGTLSDAVRNFIGERGSVLLIHGDFCPHCTTVKSPYEDAAKQLQGKVPFFTVRVDGKDTEKALRPALSKIPGYRGGVPFITALAPNGSAVATFSGPRDKANIVEFAEKYCQPQPL